MYVLLQIDVSTTLYKCAKCVIMLYVHVAVYCIFMFFLSLDKNVFKIDSSEKRIPNKGLMMKNDIAET